MYDVLYDAFSVKIFQIFMHGSYRIGLEEDMVSIENT